MKEKEKLEKLEQEKLTREEEMRQLSLHLRRRLEQALNQVI